MTEKYIDLADKISEETNSYNPAIKRVLRWLDEHPDQVPGRTITESELKGVNEWLPDTAQIGPIERRDVAEFFGITVVPDPEPTNVERLRKEIGIAWGARENPDGYDSVFDSLASRLDEAGVKAPGGDDD